MNSVTNDIWEDIEEGSLVAWFMSLEDGTKVQDETKHSRSLITSVCDNNKLIDIDENTIDQVLPNTTHKSTFNILGLPSEPHILIFRTLCPVKSVCLGLTCKTFYTIHRTIYGIKNINLIMADADNAVPLLFLLASEGWRAQNYIHKNSHWVFHTERMMSISNDVMKDSDRSNSSQSYGDGTKIN